MMLIGYYRLILARSLTPPRTRVHNLGAESCGQLRQNASMAGTTSAWTPQRRARQREMIQRTRPWTRSTGPRTREGKLRSSKNATLMRNDPVGRRAYQAMQLLLKNPWSPAMQYLWDDIRAASAGVDCDLIYNDSEAWVGDEACEDPFDFPFDE
jgi:hypothetical protein